MIEKTISWEQFHRDANALAWELTKVGPFSTIVCITRGGLVPAAIIAHKLNIKLIETVCVSSYRDTAQKEIEIIKVCGQLGRFTIIIDDLVDTGETMKAVRNFIPKAHFAVVYAKPLGKPFVNTFVTEIPQDTWINFPWED